MKPPSCAKSQISRSGRSSRDRTPQHEPNRDTVRTVVRRAYAKDSRRKAASQGDTPAHVGGEVVDRGKIVRLQFRVVVEDFLLGHSGGEPAQDIPNGDAESTYARLTGPFSGLDADSGRHDLSVASPGLCGPVRRPIVYAVLYTQMRFDWGEARNRTNRAKHGIDL